jgi:hypothetical protein
MKESTHLVAVIDKTYKIPTVKSSGYNTNYIVVLMSVLSADGSMYMCENMKILEIIWTYDCYE